jgi:hypothetical protein
MILQMPFFILSNSFPEIKSCFITAVRLKKGVEIDYKMLKRLASCLMKINSRIVKAHNEDPP